MKVNEVIEKINEMLEKMYDANYNVYVGLTQVLPFIDIIYQTFLKMVPQLNEIGMELDAEGILQQLRDVISAIEKKDKVLLFDCLYYEIKETLLLYQEIESIMESGE